MQIGLRVRCHVLVIHILKRTGRGTNLYLCQFGLALFASCKKRLPTNRLAFDMCITAVLGNRTHIARYSLTLILSKQYELTFMSGHAGPVSLPVAGRQALSCCARDSVRSSNMNQAHHCITLYISCEGSTVKQRMCSLLGPIRA